MACLWGFGWFGPSWGVTMGRSPTLVGWPGHGSPDHGGGGLEVTRQGLDGG